jgi:hypothetical protein
LFSIAYVSRRYGRPVEACGTLLSLGAPDSYIFGPSGIVVGGVR